MQTDIVLCLHGSMGSPQVRPLYLWQAPIGSVLFGRWRLAIVVKETYDSEREIRYSCPAQMTNLHGGRLTESFTLR